MDSFSANLWWSLIPSNCALARLVFSYWISVQDALMNPARIKQMHCSNSVFNKLFIKNSLNFLEFCEIVSVGEIRWKTLYDSENRRFLKYLGLGAWKPQELCGQREGLGVFSFYLVYHRRNNQIKAEIFWEAIHGIINFPEFPSRNSSCVCKIMSSLRSWSKLFGVCSLSAAFLK